MRFLSFWPIAGDRGGGVSCEARRPNNRRLEGSVRSVGVPSSLSLSTVRRTALRFVSVRIFHLSAPEWPLMALPPLRKSPAMLLKNLPLLLRSRSGAVCDRKWLGGARVDDAGWLNDPVPVPVPLLVVLLPLLSRECVARNVKRRGTLALAAAKRAFSTTSTGRASSSLESCPKSSGSSLTRLSRVDGSASSEIECAGGIRRVTEDDDSIGGRGEEDRSGTGAGLATRGGVLSRE